jgi:Zn-finger nucleic acid-binding protein
MKCPACFSELTQLQVGKLQIDACQDGCGGVWFDAFELSKVDEQDEPAEPLLQIRTALEVVVDPSRKRECPRCPGVKLYRHFFSAKRSVQVDQCPNCAGYWLDAGELALIRAERAEVASPDKKREANVSAEFIRYLYRLEEQSRQGRRQQG